ncbi:MAG: hypothetical protein EOO39_23985 [Cytophagaceae bacterium]|nr:MAG: hypothetical protein EOO39_23985 [Cytophagaceae bacterium]
MLANVKFVLKANSVKFHLDRKHMVFGKATDGIDLVDQINQGNKIQPITIIEEAAAS